MRNHVLNIVILLALAATLGRAATMSASTNAPVVDGGDIANYAAYNGTDKWWPENSGGAGSAKGQTFTTGDLKVYLTAITYQVATNQQALPTKTYVIRVGTVLGTTFTTLHSEGATQSFTWNNGEYMTWTLDTPVLLAANRTYGVDIGLTNSTSAWQTGIPYITMTGNLYSGGKRYTSGRNGIADPFLVLDSNRDRIFHVDLEYPPQGFQFILE